MDADVELTKSCLLAAARHQGMSVVECLVNCVIFNNKTHADFAGDKATRAERTIVLRHGEKMLFGANRDKGLVRENGKLKAVTVGEEGYTIDDVLTHDAHERDTSLHLMLAAMKYPDMPVAVGVIREVEDTHVYDRKVAEQVAEVGTPTRSAAWTTCSTRARRGRSDKRAITDEKRGRRTTDVRRPVFLRTVPACGAPPAEEKESQTRPKERKKPEVTIYNRPYLPPSGPLVRRRTYRFRRRRIFRHARFRHARRRRFPRPTSQRLQYLL